MARRRYNADQVADILSTLPSDDEVPSEDDASEDEGDYVEINDYPQSDEFEMECSSEQSCASTDDDDDDNDIVSGRNGFEWSKNPLIPLRSDYKTSFEFLWVLHLQSKTSKLLMTFFVM